MLRPVLTGEYAHNLDPKRRLSIPARLRKELGAGAVLTRGLDACLFLFPSGDWQTLSAKLAALPIGQQDSRAFARLMVSGACPVQFDSLGRILVPEYLAAYARLEREVVITGVLTRLEVWDARTWESYKRRLEKDSDRIAEKLGGLGVI